MNVAARKDSNNKSEKKKQTNNQIQFPSRIKQLVMQLRALLSIIEIDVNSPKGSNSVAST